MSFGGNNLTVPTLSFTFLEYFKEFGRDYIKRTSAGNSNLLAIADEVYEELTGEKLQG